MGDDKYGSALHELVHSFFDQRLGSGVNGGCCLVKNQHRRIGNGGTGNREKLALALGYLVVAPAALETAKYLEKEFGTPYEVGYPFVDELIPELGYERKKILIIHQQVIANAIRQEIRTRSDEQNTEVTVASWFMMKSELSEEGDLSLKEEMDYCKLVQNGNYDIVFADENMRGLVPGFKGTFVNVRHFAVSGKLQES